MKRRVFVVCNALDDFTRQQRGITTDSPAASRKIFLLCEALRLAGVHPCVVSLGRGRAGGEPRFFSGTMRRVHRVPIYYAPFATLPVLSELLSLFGLLGFIYSQRKSEQKAAIYYNRMLAYVPTLILTRILGFINILDLEDGETSRVSGKPISDYFNWLPRLFDRMCAKGALLSCSALASCTTVRPTLCYYGTAVGDRYVDHWNSARTSVLMGGSLSIETGSRLLIDCIKLMRKEEQPHFERLRLEITGTGPCLDDFKKLATEDGFPEVVVHGRTTDMQYHEILQRCDVGLALKLNAGSLANTTFPSKVVELASAGLLVITTDISDVRKVLGDGAFYLGCDEPGKLAEIFSQVIQQRAAAKQCALLGARKVRERCAPKPSGEMVANFIFGCWS